MRRERGLSTNPTNATREVETRAESLPAPPKQTKRKRRIHEEEEEEVVFTISQDWRLMGNLLVAWEDQLSGSSFLVGNQKRDEGNKVDHVNFQTLSQAAPVRDEYLWPGDSASARVCAMDGFSATIRTSWQIWPFEK